MMPLCNKKKQEEPPKVPCTAQKIVIPKGMINPNETTIIEIPARLHDQPLVIAKRKINSPAFTSESYRRDDDPNVSNYDDSMYGKQRPMAIQQRSTQPRVVQAPPDNYTAFMPDYNSTTRGERLPRTNLQYNMCSTPKKEYVTALDNTSALATAGSKDLNQTEIEEKMALERSLQEFQAARRKLLTNATQLARNPANFDGYNKY